MPYRYHYDPNQPRVPAGQHDGGQWTGESDSHYPLARSVFYDPRRGVIAGLLAFFAWLSRRNTPNEKSIIVFKARQYDREGTDGFDVEDVRLLTKEQVDEVCRRLQQVQNITDNASNSAKPLRGFMRPTEYGTLVHRLIKDQIDLLGDPNLRAEISHIKGKQDAQPYGAKDTVRVDVLERRDKETVCVYDI